jgi:hypothetical protein
MLMFIGFIELVGWQDNHIVEICQTSNAVIALQTLFECRGGGGAGGGICLIILWSYLRQQHFSYKMLILKCQYKDHFGSIILLSF